MPAGAVAAWIAALGAIGAAVGVGAALEACAPRGAAAPIGVSQGGTGEARASDGGAASEPAARTGVVPPDFRTTMTKVNHARFVSNGHAAGRFEADVYANEAGVEALARTQGEAPVGARIVMEHVERAGPNAGKTAAVMMMEKRAKGSDPERGDWRYTVVGSNGETLQQGAIEACAGCHADAPGDHLFRIVE